MSEENRYLVDIYSQEPKGPDITKAKMIVICYTITTQERMWHDPICDQETVMIVREQNGPIVFPDCAYSCSKVI